MPGTNDDARPFRPAVHAAAHPDKPAIVAAGTGVTVPYRELEERSARLANAFRAMGQIPGDHVALLLPNHERFLEVAWAALRSGLYLTPVNPQLTAEEVAYIVDDCGARVLVTSVALADVAAAVVDRTPGVGHRVALGGGLDGHDDLDAVLRAQPVEPTGPETEGMTMAYTSGTTGKPKGVLRPLSGLPVGVSDPIAYVDELVGLSFDSVLLTPAPLCHSAPLAWSLAVIRRGGTLVLMDRFDAEGALAAIERHRVTHAQFVPTMFVRMLKLPEAARRYDTSSLRSALHVGSACPPDVKRAMIDWLGPIVDEYYAGSEGNGATFVTSTDWLAHPGTVGRAVRGTVHITADDGSELPPGEQGTVRFESPSTFEYHNDPEKTAAGRDHRGWSTLGDVGYLDADGYLYLTDRADFMIIVGGVNVYPQEVENALVMHPAVDDVAVFGIPDPEYGEQVKAVVQASAAVVAGPGLADEIIAFCRERLARYKCPRTVDFVDVLPRHDSGKLQKAALRARYAAGA